MKHLIINVGKHTTMMPPTRGHDLKLQRWSKWSIVIAGCPPHGGTT